MTAFVGLRRGHEGAALGNGRRAPPPHASRDGARRVGHQRVQPGLGEGPRRPDGSRPPPGRCPRAASAWRAPRSSRARSRSAASSSCSGLHEPVTTALAAFTLVSYVCVYTPMKTRSPASTIVGRDSGRAPAARRVHGGAGGRDSACPGSRSSRSSSSGSCRTSSRSAGATASDYAKAGVVILPVVDPTGAARPARRSSGRPSSCRSASCPSLVGTAGFATRFGAFAMTLLFLASSLRFAREITDGRARSLFLASIAWLPRPRPRAPRRSDRIRPAAARDRPRRRARSRSPAPTATRARATASRSRSRPARSSGSSVRTGAARRRSSASSRPCSARRPAPRRARSGTTTHASRVAGSASSSRRRASTGSSP